jgi:hypothetical protein
MAGRQPIPTTLPPYGPRNYQPNSPMAQHVAEEIALGRLLRDARAQVPPEEWEEWLKATRPDMLEPTGFGLSVRWKDALHHADAVDLTDEEFIARCRTAIAAWHARRVEQGLCRAPETSVERELVDRYLDMWGYRNAVMGRIGTKTAYPPRMRALAKRLRKRGLLPASVREKTDDEPPKLSRTDRAWEKAKAKGYWAKRVAEHGEELARRIWAVNKVGQASNALAAARRNHLTDPLAQLAFKRWEQDGFSPRDAVLSVTKEP